MITPAEIINYVNEKYLTVPDHPWQKYLDYTVLRHRHSGKWYGLIMKVPAHKLGLSGTDKVEVINLKSDPLLVNMLNHPDIFPAYHMNKKHWITVLLNRSMPKAEIFRLIDLSFELTN